MAIFFIAMREQVSNIYRLQPSFIKITAKKQVFSAFAQISSVLNFAAVVYGCIDGRSQYLSQKPV